MPLPFVQAQLGLRSLGDAARLIRDCGGVVRDAAPAAAGPAASPSAAAAVFDTKASAGAIVPSRELTADMAAAAALLEEQQAAAGGGPAADARPALLTASGKRGRRAHATPPPGAAAAAASEGGGDAVEGSSVGVWLRKGAAAGQKRKAAAALG